MIRRTVEKKLQKLASQFKAIAVVGPRQSGKTTLCRHIFPHLPYVSFENPDVRQFAIDDPRGFVTTYKEGAIFDEMQRMPDLFSYMQQVLDEMHEVGRFVFTGSNHFLLQQSISQSLAGRVAYVELLPFSYEEIQSKKELRLDLYLLNGSYPPIYDQPVDAQIWLKNYYQTYVEKDVRLIKNINNLNAFERLLKLLAARVGQLLNYQSLAVEVGVDNKTIQSWIGILESSFIVYRLAPHFQNFSKRVVKMPKLYFYDTGLVSSILNISSEDILQTHIYKGALFENMIINELLKLKANTESKFDLYFWRDHVGNEIDLVIDNGRTLYPIECKSGATIVSEFSKSIEKWFKISGQNRGTVMYAGDMIQKRSNGVTFLPWNKLSQLQAITSA